MARRLATSIETFCADASQELLTADKALDDEAMAWLILCARGWPREVRADAETLTAARPWMAAWSEYVTLPVHITSSLDTAHEHEMRGLLGRCEAELRPSLPRAVWELVDPLDALGRATLACVLQALAAWVDAHSRALLAAQRTTHLRERVERLVGEARALDLTPPSDSLDLAGWQALAELAKTAPDVLPRVASRR